MVSNTIIQGTMNGGRRRGGQKKRWEENIKEWPGLCVSETLRESKDLKGWREVIIISVVAPI